ncbi:MAG: hypothetical protein HC877_23275 [Thioploca sp.]|nr:hypothetical protein [Thioploca sp.]
MEQAPPFPGSPATEPSPATSRSPQFPEIPPSSSEAVISEELEDYTPEMRQATNSYRLSQIIRSAQKEILNGNNGLAAALLAKGSQMAEDLGAMRQSMHLYMMAKDLLDEKSRY